MLIGHYLLEFIEELLDLRYQQDEPPAAMSEYMDAEKFRTSQAYQQEQRRLGLSQTTFSTAATIVFIVFGGFNWLDQHVRRFGGDSEYANGLLFVAAWFGICVIFYQPFRLYRLFHLEARYGFNRTTVRTYIADGLKGLVLAALLGVPTFLAVIWFFAATGDWAWVFCWILIVIVQFILVSVAPVVIMPMFNKFSSLEAGELRSAIEAYAASQNFAISGVFTMDGSKRSAKSNAFFAGFGKSRRIVLFDTLIENHTVPELLAVVAHEMGHCKKRHIPKGIILSILSTGLSLYILSVFIANPGLFDAFGMADISIYAGLVFVAYLYTPVATILGVAGAVVSRRFEYEADAFAAATSDATAMISALKKLSSDNYANLTPHPLKVFISYSHPPVLHRIAAIEGRPL